jgi:hypothetical protein
MIVELEPKAIAIQAPVEVKSVIVIIFRFKCIDIGLGERFH